MTTENQVIEKGISELVGALCDPTIVYPGGWEDTIPDWLRHNVPLERLIECMKSHKGEEPTGTDSEAVIYLYTASLCFPFDHDWTEIYLYLGRKVYERWRTPDSGVTFPDDIKVESLRPEQERDLSRLKAWIYERRVQSRQMKDRAERREKKEAAKVRRGVQANLEFDW